MLGIICQFVWWVGVRDNMQVCEAGWWGWWVLVVTVVKD